MFATVFSKLDAIYRANDFTCEDCERWNRCDLQSNDNCIFREEQIARGKWKAKRELEAILNQSRYTISLGG